MTIVQPRTIEFDHAAAASNDGLSIRVNATHPAGPWTPTSGASRGAFALVPTKNQALTIRATFSVNVLLPLPASSVMIRARPILGTTSILGAVGATSVPIPSGSGASVTPPVSFPLVGVDIWNSGIGRYGVSWMWQLQLHPNDPWIDIGRSDHTIYVTLDVPSPPWGQASDAPHQVLWPWTDVLDYACGWASGVTVSSTLEDAAASAAKKVEQALFDLGERPLVPLVYGGLPRYAPSSSTGVITFALTSFLRTLSGIPPAGPTAEVDCADCSAALLTFANALGCGLRLHRVQQKESIGGIGFDSNPLRLIGKHAAKADFYSQHDVTIRPEATEGEHRVFDSCLMVDFDANPASAKSATFKLPHGVTRGMLTSGSKSLNWIRRLVKERDWSNCEGRDLNVPCLDSCVDPQAPSKPIVVLWQHYRDVIDRLVRPAGPERRVNVAGEAPPIAGFDIYERVDSPTHLAVLAPLVALSVEYFYVGRGKGDRRITVSLAAAHSVSGARDTLAWLMTQSNLPPAAIRSADYAAGDVSFAEAATRAGYFSLGTVVARVHSVGRTPVAVQGFLRIVEEAVINMPPAAVGDSPGAT